MKNFEERKAEIFRRSEERRYAAKIRTRVLVACVPLALCLAAAVAVYPSLTDVPSNNHAAPTSPTLPVVRQCVEIRAESYYQQYTDLQTFTAVADTLNTIIDNAESENAPLPNQTLFSGSDTETDIAPEYTITLTDENGICTYMLTGNTLIAGNTGINYRLSDNEATTLRILISNDQRHRSVGMYLEGKNDTHMLIINNSVTVLRDVSDLFAPFDDIRSGDTILVFHSEVQETYPAAADAYYCLWLKRGSIDEIPDDVITNLSMLGWLESTVSYTPLKPADGESRVPFGAQYILTHIREDDYPRVTVIHSVEELQAYYEAYKNTFNLERCADPNNILMDATIGFLDACDKYDETYFQDRVLVLAVLSAPGICHRFQVTDLRVTETGQLIADIAELCPMATDMEVGSWHIFIEPEAGINVIDKSYVTVNHFEIELH